jgi:hypothetical protein
MTGTRKKSPATATNQKKHVLSHPDKHIYPRSKKNVYILLLSEVSSGRK